MKYLLILMNCIAVASVLSSCSGKETATSDSQGIKRRDTVPFVGSFKVNRYVLNNDLRVLIVEDHSSPTFAYYTFYRVGSRDETPGYTGLAHLFEHMMFKETKNMKDGEFDKIMETAGAEGNNAFTSRDMTGYVQELPSDKLDLIAKLESDRMNNLIVNDNAFKTEREVVQNERRFRFENSPDGTMDAELYGLAFTKHPYHWPIIGYSEDLQRMTAEDAMKFYRTHYSPNHATIVIVGDVDSEHALETVQKYYGDLQPQTAPSIPIAPEPVQTAARRKTIKLNIKVEKLSVAYKSPSVLDEDIPAINMLQGVLSIGKSSRLHRALVESGICSKIHVGSTDEKDNSLFVFECGLQVGKKAAQAEAVLEKELVRIVKQPPSDGEIMRVRNKINFQYYEGLDSNGEKARFLGHFEGVGGNFEVGFHIHNKMQYVSALEIQAAAKRVFQSNQKTVVIGVPK